MADIKTALFTAHLADWHALRRDDARLRTVHARLHPDLFPEERAAEDRFLAHTLVAGNYYAALTARQMRKLDRVVVLLLEAEMALAPLVPAHHAYRYDWVHGYMERAGIAPRARDLWYWLCQGRRFGAVGAAPEDVPYYAWLTSVEVRELALVLPGVLERMEREREAGGLRMALQRRGAANDAAYWLCKEVVPALSGAAARDEDVVALTVAR